MSFSKRSRSSLQTDGNDMEKMDMEILSPSKEKDCRYFKARRLASVTEDNSKNLSEHSSMDTTVSSSNSSKRRSSNISVAQELRCPICLAEKEDPTMLSDCQHTFCYGCIVEWLKMKPECPLCKRVPKFFKHGFQLSNSQMDKPTWNTPAIKSSVSEMRAMAEMEFIIMRTSYTADVERHAVMQVVRRLEEEIRMLQHMSSRTYAKSSYYKLIIKDTQDELLIYENLLNMFSTASRRELFNEPAFRRVIYLRNLSPRSIVSPRFGIVFNTDYVKSNEAAVRAQLSSYILREFAAITRQESVDVDALMKVIFDYLTNRANRNEPVNYLKKHGICHPHQFLNNLAHFAGTGQALAVYDQNSEFTPRGTNNVLPYISSNDDIVVINSAVNNDVQVVGETMNTAGTSLSAGASTDASRAHTLLNSQRALDRYSQRYEDIQNRIQRLRRRIHGHNNDNRTNKSGSNREVVVNLSDSSSENDSTQSLNLEDEVILNDDESTNYNANSNDGNYDNDEVAAIELSPPRCAENILTTGGGNTVTTSSFTTSSTSTWPNGNTFGIPLVTIGGRDNISNVSRPFGLPNPYSLSSMSNDDSPSRMNASSYVYTPTTDGWRRLSSVADLFRRN